MTAKVFCAIDTTEMERAVDLTRALGGHVHGFKLGLEFFTAQGAEGVRDIRRTIDEATLFLDLKFHDIPNTVAGAVKAAVRCEADFLTIHTSGGTEMMKAALNAAREESQKTGYKLPKILGVTVLTSMDADNLKSVGQEPAPTAQVLRLAKLAESAGLHGLVCSPKELGNLRAELGKTMTLVVPGIRPAESDTGDQKRVMTPKEASDAGADWLVIGRPITEAKDPVKAAKDIINSLSS